MKEKNKCWDTLLVGVCMSFFVGMAIVGFCLPEKGFSESENRYLQKSPPFSWEALLDGSFADDYETYLSDQFPWRVQWVGGKTLVEWLMGKGDTNGVYFGKNGYLIERFEAEDIEGELLSRNQEILAGALKRMEVTYGTDHVRAMLVPSAAEILSEYLPPFASFYTQDVIIAEMQKQWNCLELMVPANPALREHKKEPIYYRTDHHWTTLGAYYGYVAWMESLGEEPWSLEQFEATIVSEDFLGTIYSKVQGARRPDRITLYQPKTDTSFEVEYDDSGVWTNGLYNYEALKTRDQYTIFLDGNHGLTRIRNKTKEGEGERKGKRLLIIKDSYAHSFAPFAVNHYEETLMVDLRYFNANVESFAKAEGVTDVLVLYRIPGFATETTISKLR